MKKYDSGPYATARIGERLRATRLAMGLAQQDFADRAGLGQSAYNQVETGRKRPSVDTGLALCEVYDITLDWIYRGEGSGLPYRLWDELRKHIDPD